MVCADFFLLLPAIFFLLSLFAPFVLVSPYLFFRRLSPRLHLSHFRVLTVKKVCCLFLPAFLLLLFLFYSRHRSSSSPWRYLPERALLYVQQKLYLSVM
jgi:hypothetical protein